MATTADLAELQTATKADIADLKADLLKWVFGVVLTVAGIQTAALVAVLRLLID